VIVLPEPGEKCGTKGCDARALFVVFWPGQTIELCRPCALRALEIAKVMGFVLDVRANELSHDLAARIVALLPSRGEEPPHD
jgi:hypothetical protein